MPSLKHRAYLVLPDRWARSVRFYRAHGAFPRVRHPRTFSEKVNWRVLHDRRPLLAWTCDKLRMKEVAARHPTVRVPRTLWWGEDLLELRGVDLPRRWVLKPNHRTGLVFIGEGPVDDTRLDRLRRETARWLDPAEVSHNREWAYAQARPAYLVEEFIGEGAVPVDYKFFVFHGEPRMILVDSDRFTDHRRSIFSPDWRLLPVEVKFPSAGALPRPRHLDRMLDAARELGRDFDFIRVDLYETGDDVWFGEFTPYPGSGFSPIRPRSFDHEWGALWQLPGR